jgi:hypothetical protein
VNVIESNGTRRPVSLQTYQRLSGEVFPTEESLKWFIRRNRVELVETGALVMPAGKKLAVVDRFDQVVQQVGERRARASTQ